MPDECAEVQAPPQPRSIWPTVARAFAFIVVVAISVAIFYLSDKLEQFSAYGYAGVFLISLAGNATLILPAPFLLIVYAMGAVLNPILVGLVAGVGGALGELTGYLAGFSGRAIIEDRARYEQMTRWMQRHGGLTIFVLSLLPNPFFDIAGISAGALRYPVWRFLLFCLSGKTIKTVAVAIAGAMSFQSIEKFLF
jgi:membrane protein DedA with SNARE-associated domain